MISRFERARHQPYRKAARLRGCLTREACSVMESPGETTGARAADSYAQAPARFYFCQVQHGPRFWVERGP